MDCCTVFDDCADIQADSAKGGTKAFEGAAKSDYTDANAAAEESNPDTVITDDTPIEYKKVNLTPVLPVSLSVLAAYIWVFGICVFLAVVFASYFVYTYRKNKNSVAVSDNEILARVKGELNIKRHIGIKMSPDVRSPMLVGVFFPTVYIPCREIPDGSMRMVLLHELTHYKRKDLLVKWIAVFINAVHWFNPLCYLACANLSEACEVSCDMAVTKNMTGGEQKLYMQTILDLVEERS